MEVKTFSAANMRDAMKAVKGEFGTDAVILSSKEKHDQESNLKIYEITATGPKKKMMGAVQDKTKGDLAMIQRFDQLDIRLSYLNDIAAKKSHLQGLETAIDEIRLLVLSLNRTPMGQLPDVPEVFSETWNRLKMMGVAEERLVQLAEHINNLPQPEASEDTARYLKDHAIRWMMQRVRIAPRLSQSQDGLGIHAFVGPVGSGKSSLVAKLASQAKKKDQILVVSLDPYRAGASEFLRVCAKVAGVPFVQISEVTDLPKEISSRPGLELVLVDTFGISAKRPDGLTLLQSLSEQPVPIDFHAVLSVIERPDQLDRAIRFLNPIGLASAAFTRVEESNVFAEIFNISCKWNLPLSYFGCGPEVPGDVERASRERLMEKMFGL